MYMQANSFCIIYNSKTDRTLNVWAFPEVQWLRTQSHFKDTGSIPGQGTEILHAAWHGQKKERT